MRNHTAQNAITLAEEGDFSEVTKSIFQIRSATILDCINYHDNKLIFFIMIQTTLILKGVVKPNSKTDYDNKFLSWQL